MTAKSMNKEAALLRLAKRFYTRAESPTPADFEVVFRCLLYRDQKQLEDLLADFGVALVDGDEVH